MTRQVYGVVEDSQHFDATPDRILTYPKKQEMPPLPPAASNMQHPNAFAYIIPRSNPRNVWA